MRAASFAWCPLPNPDVFNRARLGRVVRPRLREVLGVWAPMLVGLLLVAVAANFLIAARGPSVDPYFRLDPVSSTLCGAGVIAI